MFNLSRRAWNNVIIFSMLGLIFFLHSMDAPEKKPSSGQPLSLLPSDSLVMTIEMEQHQIQRVGQGWRVVPADSKWQERELAQLVSSWQELVVVPRATEVTVMPYVVVIWLAGDSQGRVVQLFPGTEPQILSYQGRTFEILNQNISALTLRGR